MRAPLASPCRLRLRRRVATAAAPAVATATPMREWRWPPHRPSPHRLTGGRPARRAPVVVVVVAAVAAI
eukprot:ctg_5534.g478